MFNETVNHKGLSSDYTAKIRTDAKQRLLAVKGVNL